MTKDHVKIKYLVQKNVKSYFGCRNNRWHLINSNKLAYSAVAIIILKQLRYQILVYCLSYYVKNFNLGNVKLITT